jgi:hypothetical protein
VYNQLKNRLLDSLITFLDVKCVQDMYVDVNRVVVLGQVCTFFGILTEYMPAQVGLNEYTNRIACAEINISILQLHCLPAAQKA